MNNPLFCIQKDPPSHFLGSSFNSLLFWFMILCSSVTLNFLSSPANLQRAKALQQAVPPAPSPALSTSVSPAPCTSVPILGGNSPHRRTLPWGMWAGIRPVPGPEGLQGSNKQQNSRQQHEPLPPCLRAVTAASEAQHRRC